MRGFSITLGLGLGVTTGSGIIYLLLSSEAGRLIAAFVAGGLLIGGMIMFAVIMTNRNWGQILAAGPRNRMPGPHYPEYSTPPMLPAGGGVYSPPLPIIEANSYTPTGALADDRPVA